MEGLFSFMARWWKERAGRLYAEAVSAEPQTGELYDRALDAQDVALYWQEQIPRESCTAERGRYR